MKRHETSTKKMQEIQFVLENILITQPQSNYKYKIRVCVCNNSQDIQQSSAQKAMQIFKIPLRDQPLGLKRECGYVYLLERNKNAEDEIFYEIGKGEIDMGILYKNEQNSSMILKGIIYGIRSFNFGKIIAKYQYNIIRKIKQQSVGNEDMSDQKEKKMLNYQFVNHKVKKNRYFLDPLDGKQKQINKKSEQINQKLRELTTSIDIDSEDPYQDYNRIDSTLNTNKNLAKQAQIKLTDLSCYYSYEEKFYCLLSESRQKQFYVFNIKNVKINSPPNGNSGRKDKNQATNLCIVFHEIDPEQQCQREILRVLLHIKYKVSNTHIDTINFYFPKTSNKIGVETFELAEGSKKLKGQLNLVENKSKIFELFEADEEKGYIMIEVGPISRISKKQIKQYKTQIQQFLNATINLNKILENSPTKKFRSSLKQSRKRSFISRQSLENSKKIPNYELKQKKTFSSIKENEEVRKSMSKSRINLLESHMRQKKYHKRSRTQESINVLPQVFTGAKRLKSRVRKSNAYEIVDVNPQKSKHQLRRQSQVAEQISRYKSNTRLFNFENSRRRLKGGCNIEIITIVINLYEENNLNPKFLRLELQNQKIQTKTIESSKIINWRQLNIQFDNIDLKQNLRIQCLHNKEASRNQNFDHSTITIGRSIIFLSQLKQNEISTYRTFLILQNSIIGYLVLEYKLQSNSFVRQKQNPSSQRNPRATPVNQFHQQQEYQLSISNSQIKDPFIFQKKEKVVKKKSMIKAHEADLQEDDYNHFRHF